MAAEKAKNGIAWSQVDCHNFTTLGYFSPNQLATNWSSSCRFGIYRSVDGLVGGSNLGPVLLCNKVKLLRIKCAMQVWWGVRGKAVSRLRDMPLRPSDTAIKMSWTPRDLSSLKTLNQKVALSVSSSHKPNIVSGQHKMKTPPRGHFLTPLQRKRD